MNSRYSWPTKLVCGGILAVILSVCYLGVRDAQASAKGGGGSQRDPLATAYWQVEVEGRWSGTFRACSGIGSENDAVEAKTADKGEKGGPAGTIAKIPGRLHWHDITLTRGLTGDMKLWAWRQEVVVGKVAGARQKCTITLMNQEGKVMAIWELANAWPTNLTIGSKGDTNTVTEEVVIAHEGVTRRQ